MPKTEQHPPERHVSRDLRIAMRYPAEGRLELRIPAVPEVLRADGTVRAEVLMTILDEATGFAAVLSALPGWASTAALHVGFANRPAADEVRVEVQLVKAGKRLVFLAADLRSGHESLGWASAEFAHVPRSGQNEEMGVPRPDPRIEHDLALEESTLDGPFPDAAGLVTVDAATGVVELELGSWVRNTGGMLHGGMVGALVVRAAELASGGVATSADVQFLAAGRVGPFRTGAVALGDRGDERVWRVETRDLGRDEVRPMTRALVVTDG